MLSCRRPPRRLPRSLLLIALLAALPAAARAAEPAEEQPAALTFHEIAPGIHAGLQPAAGRFDDCNVLLVIGKDAVLVVDAPAKRAALEALAAGIRARTDLPVRWLVNTHWHTDHTQGNAYLMEQFGPGVTVVGHESLAEDVPGRAAPQIAERAERLRTMLPQAEEQLAKGLGLQGQELDAAQQEQQRAGIDQARAWLAANADLRFVPPMLAYATGITLHLAPYTVELRHRPGHTRGDTVLWIPQAGVLASGDLLDDLPYIGHGFPRTWVASLEAVGDWPFTTVVPGHGPLFRDRAQYDKVLGFLQALLARAAAVQEAGGSLTRLQEAPEMDAWRARFVAEGDAAAGRFYDAVLAEALERAWRDVTGDLDPATD